MNDIKDKLEKLLKKHKINNEKLSEYKYKCNKNNENFDIEINNINDNEKLFYITLFGKEGKPVKNNNKFLIQLLLEK